ncbi:MAG: mechanosensitive ion channel [Deltaproteobacteria bacterium]|nr:mechanosensitive ion channel [Deltaproteobacteria bacterium]
MRSWRLPLALLIALLLPGKVHAAFPLDNPLLKGAPASTPAAQKKAYTPEEIQTLKQGNAQELEQAHATLDQSPESAPQQDLQNLKNRVQVLEGMDLLYGDILDAFNNQGKVQDRLKALEVDLRQWQTGTPPKEFTIDFSNLDKLRGQEVESKKTIKTRDQVYKSRQEALDEAKKEFQSAEQDRRKAKEAVESASTIEEKAPLEQTLTLMQLKSRSAEMRVLLRELELDVSKNYREFFQKQQELTSTEIAYLEKRVNFTDEDLKREINLIETEENKVGEQLDKARKELANSEKEYGKARDKLSEDVAPPPALIEEVEARRLNQSYLGQVVDLLTERLKQMKERREYWKKRFALLNGQIEKPEIAVWQQQTRQYLDQLKRDEDLGNLRLTSLRNNSAEIEEKIRSKSDADPETQRWLQKQKDETLKNIELMQDHLASMLLSRKLNEKFLAEQDARYSHVSFSEQMSRLWDRSVHVWNYEITSVDDSPITVSKVFFAIIFMTFGLYLARKLSRMLVRVPLTLFAVLGGAVAIGIGFGSQNLMNNFISGLILLIERPIKMGDIIEMEGNAGIVEQIGGRSTQIRTFSNIHMIVPNSSFLEKTVINWTLSDNMIRSNIRVGVDYGTPTRQVVDLLKKAADSHGKILKSPEPIVLFTDFAADSLIFDLYFWVKIQTALERRIVESDLRFIIEGDFEEAGIKMAYRQQDVHLDTKAPLQVQIMKE